MSYRAVVFAVSADEVSQAALLARLPRATFTEKTWRIIEKVPPVYASPELAPPESQRHAYVAMASESDASRSGLRYFLLGLNDAAWDYWYRFEFANFVEALAPWTLVTLSHDDRSGVFFFERRGPKTPKLCWLLTVGARYGGTVTKFSVDFAQKAFDNAALAQIAGKPESRMSKNERHAVTEADDAITIGLRQYFPSARYGEYVDLLHATRVWRYNTVDAPVEVLRPSRFRPLVGRIPSKDHIRRAGLAGEAQEVQ